jgi:hypothetical protein
LFTTHALKQLQNVFLNYGLVCIQDMWIQITLNSNSGFGMAFLIFNKSAFQSTEITSGLASAIMGAKTELPLQKEITGNICPI